MQHAGGMLLPPVQTLVATLIFAKGKNANRIHHPPFCGSKIYHSVNSGISLKCNSNPPSPPSRFTKNAFSFYVCFRWASRCLVHRLQLYRYFRIAHFFLYIYTLYIEYIHANSGRDIFFPLSFFLSPFSKRRALFPAVSMDTVAFVCFLRNLKRIWE